MSNLEQTKNSFKIIGKVSRIDKDGAFREDEITKEGKNKGKTYRSLRFGVKSSETNEVTVQMFDFYPEEVFLWNSDKKKKDPSYKGDRIPFSKWEKDQDKLRDKGFAVLQTRIGLNYGEDGKLQSRGLPGYVASEEIYEALDNGDSVVVEGNVSYSTYENTQTNKTVLQRNFNINKVFRLKDIDFENEKFEEVSYFEQEIVFVDAEEDRAEKKVYVTGRHINYNKTFIDVEFVVNYSDGEDGVDDGMKKLADAFLKRFKFGDVVNVFGNVVNRVIIEEVEDEESNEEEDLLKSLGGKSKPQHAQSYQNRTYISEMNIEGVDAWDKQRYSEEDFESDDILEEDNKLQEELGGKKKNNKNPFAVDVDEDSEDDYDPDDLPF